MAELLANQPSASLVIQGVCRFVTVPERPSVTAGDDVGPIRLCGHCHRFHRPAGGCYEPPPGRWAIELTNPTPKET